jgi:hypothetical protein
VYLQEKIALHIAAVENAAVFEHTREGGTIDSMDADARAMTEATERSLTEGDRSRDRA